MNRTEHGYAAIEGLAGTMIQPYLVRLGSPVTEADLRRVLRALVAAAPKLRTVVEPGPHRCHFRVLPEGPLIDQLFERVLRVEPHVDLDDSEALLAWHRDALHEVVPLERGLGVRVRFVPHPHRPAFIFGVPHIFADGMTMVHLVSQLLRGLEGWPIEPMPLEAPSMLGAIAPVRWWHWPRQVWRARAHRVAESRRLARLHIQQLPTTTQPHYTTTGLCHHTVPVGTLRLRAAARALGVSLNTFVVAGLAQTFLDQAPDDPQAAAVIRISVNLRRYYPEAAGHGPLWGNHVGAFLVIEQDAHKPLAERVRSIEAAIREGQARYARREMAWTYLWEELMPWLGRTLIGHIAVKMMRAGRFPKISCHATSLGDVGGIQPPAGRLRVEQMVGVVNSISPLPVLTELDGVLTIPMTWQRAETDEAAVHAFLRRVDAVLARMADEALAATDAAPDAPPAPPATRAAA